MNLEEAQAWLQGERSTINSIPYDSLNWLSRIAKADAAMLQQAYWIVRAHNEGMLKVPNHETEAERTVLCVEKLLSCVLKSYLKEMTNG